MKKTSIMILVVLLVCVSVNSVQAYTSEEHNFSIDPPSGWTVDDTYPGTVVTFYGPTEEGFGININVVIESVPLTMTVEQYISANKDALNTGLDNYELVSESTRVINKVDAYEMVSTFTYTNVAIKNKQILLVHANTAYIITCSALPTTYQKYLSTFESSIETFNIIDEAVPEFPSYILALAALTVVAVVGLVYKKRIKS